MDLSYLMNDTILGEVDPNFPNGYSLQNDLVFLDNRLVRPLISVSNQISVPDASRLQSTSVYPQAIVPELPNACVPQTSACPQVIVPELPNAYVPQTSACPQVIVPELPNAYVPQTSGCRQVIVPELPNACVPQTSGCPQVIVPELLNAYVPQTSGCPQVIVPELPNTSVLQNTSTCHQIKHKQYRGDLIRFLREALDNNRHLNNLNWVNREKGIFSVYLPDLRKGELFMQYETVLKDWCKDYACIKYSTAKNRFLNALKRSDYLKLLKPVDDQKILFRFANEEEIKEKKQKKRGNNTPLTVGDDYVAVDISTVSTDSKSTDTLSPASSGYHTAEDPDIDHNEMDTSYDAVPLSKAPDGLSEDSDLVHVIDSSVKNLNSEINDAEMDVDEYPHNLISDVYLPPMTAFENEDNIFCRPNGYMPNFDDLMNEDESPFKKLFASNESLNEIKDTDILPEHQSHSVQPGMEINGEDVVREKFYWCFTEKHSYGIFTLLIFVKKLIENDTEVMDYVLPPGVIEPGLEFSDKLELEDELYVYLKPSTI